MVLRRLMRMLGEVLRERAFHLHTASSYPEAQSFLRAHRVDLLFLDLNLFGRDGFLLLEELVKGPFATVVVSADRERALEAYQYGVLDYVTKPFNVKRLAQAIERFDERGGRDPSPALAVQAKGRLVRISLGEVRAIHGAGNYSEIETDSGGLWLYSGSLDHLETLLPTRFVRVHRSHIVDLDRVRMLENQPGSRYRLILDSGNPVPVGRTRLAYLRSLLDGRY